MVPKRGPTYKAEVKVEGVQTRALLDHGARVSLVRKQLLPLIKEKINVSRQHLSLFSPEIGGSIPWVGHTGKLRKGGSYVRGDRDPMNILPNRRLEVEKR